MNATRFANTVVIGAIGFLGLLFIYAITRNVQTYYLVSIAVLICVPISSIRLSSAHRVKFAFVLLSTVFTLFAADVVLTVATHSFSSRTTDLNNRTPSEIVEDLSRGSVNAYPSLNARDFIQPGVYSRAFLPVDPDEVFPLTGISDEITVMCNETGEPVIYQSDEYGFHNPKGMWEFDQIDIAVIGDSFTQGLCVASNGKVVALIRDLHPRTLNLGISGAGPLIQLKPKVVLWDYFEGNDLNDLGYRSRVPQLMRYLEADYSQNLVVEQERIDQLVVSLVNKG